MDTRDLSDRPLAAQAAQAGMNAVEGKLGTLDDAQFVMVAIAGSRADADKDNDSTLAIALNGERNVDSARIFDHLIELVQVVAAQAGKTLRVFDMPSAGAQG